MASVSKGNVTVRVATFNQKPTTKRFKKGTTLKEAAATLDTVVKSIMVGGVRKPASYVLKSKDFITIQKNVKGG